MYHFIRITKSTLKNLIKMTLLCVFSTFSPHFLRLFSFLFFFFAHKNVEIFLQNVEPEEKVVFGFIYFKYFTIFFYLIPISYSSKKHIFRLFILGGRYYHIYFYISFHIPKILYVFFGGKL